MNTSGEDDLNALRAEQRDERVALDAPADGEYFDGTYEWIHDESEWTPVHAPSGMPSHPSLNSLRRVVKTYVPVLSPKKYPAGAVGRAEALADGDPDWMAAGDPQPAPDGATDFAEFHERIRRALYDSSGIQWMSHRGRSSMVQAQADRIVPLCVEGPGRLEAEEAATTDSTGVSADLYELLYYGLFYSSKNQMMHPRGRASMAHEQAVRLAPLVKLRQEVTPDPRYDDTPTAEAEAHPAAVSMAYSSGYAVGWSDAQAGDDTRSKRAEVTMVHAESYCKAHTTDGTGTEAVGIIRQLVGHPDRAMSPQREAVTSAPDAEALSTLRTILWEGRHAEVARRALAVLDSALPATPAHNPDANDAEL